MTINRYFDHTLLKPEATESQIAQIIADAKKYQFKSVCVNPTWVAYAAEALHDQPEVAVCTVIGFPLGANAPETKAFEAHLAEKQGATEVDMVLNIGRLKAGDHAAVQADIEAVVQAVTPTTIVKVIIETCLLTDEEKKHACELAKAAGADFVKTSTGFSTGGATVADIRLMRATVGPTMGVKASGGVKTAADVAALLEAGATRIGTSSGVQLMEQETISDDAY